jgi:hypothetical protein
MIPGNHHVFRRSDIWDNREIQSLRNANLKCQKSTTEYQTCQIQTQIRSLGNCALQSVPLLLCEKILMASLKTLNEYSNNSQSHKWKEGWTPNLYDSILLNPILTTMVIQALDVTLSDRRLVRDSTILWSKLPSNTHLDHCVRVCQVPSVRTKNQGFCRS